MKYQRQPTTSFGPRQHLPIKKKRPGPRMMKIIKEVRCRQAYMPLSGANRGGNVENTGCARNGKTYYDSSKSTQLNEGQDIAVVVKPRKYPLGDSVAMANGNIVPLGKSKEVAVSPSSVDLKKSPSCFRNEFSSNVLEKPALHVLKSNSSGANKIAKKSPHSKKILFGKRKAVTSSRGLTILVETPLVLDKVKVVASIQGNVVGHGVHFVDEHHKGQSLKEKLKNPSSRSKRILGTEDFRGSSDIHRRVETSCMGNNTKQNGGPTTEDCRTDNDGFKSKRKGLLEKIPREHSKGSEDTKTSRPVKRRRYICTADEDEDEDDISGDDRNVICGDDHNITGIEDGTDGFISQTAIVERYGSLPIDEPIWSGMLKIGSEGCVSLEAHLLAKSCEQVWKCSRSLLNMVQVTKLSRLEAEPKCFRVSRPTEDNIGLYFFPQGMRPNEYFDKLVKEVMDNDLILRAAVDEAEMLIFPSILLPEKHQTFQGKHYLWGLFKRREDKVNVEGEEHMRGTSLSGHVKENEDMERWTDSLARLNVSTCPTDVAEAATPPPAAAAATSHAPSRQAERAAAVVAMTPAPAAMSQATSSTRPAEGAAAEATTPAPAAAAAMCHAASSVVPHGGMFCFIVGQNPRIQQLIQEIEREGAVVFAMRGETMGYGLGNSGAAE